MTWSIASVLVTGAASGLGREVALRLGREKVAVHCLDLQPDAAEGIAAKIRRRGGIAEAIAADVSDEAQMAAAFARIARAERPLEGLVTCAGVTNKTSLLSLSLAEWERTLAVNLRGTFLAVRGAMAIMAERRAGRIVTIGSDVGKRGGGRMAKSAYGAAKGGVIAFTRSVAREFAPLKGAVRINCLCPGPMMTAMHEGIRNEDRDTVERTVPLGRFGEPGEVAAAALFLLSDEASFVYGETLNADGGVVMD